MNKTAKKWLGVGSFIIIGLMLILSAFIVIKIFSVIGTAISYGMTASEIDMLFYSAMPSFMLTAVFAFIISVANIILMVYYIILEAKDTNEGSSSKGSMDIGSYLSVFMDISVLLVFQSMEKRFFNTIPPISSELQL